MKQKQVKLKQLKRKEGMNYNINHTSCNSIFTEKIVQLFILLNVL